MLAACIDISPATTAEPNELVYVPNSTKKICLLTGDFDRETGTPTLSQTEKRFGVVATAPRWRVRVDGAGGRTLTSYGWTPVAAVEKRPHHLVGL